MDNALNTDLATGFHQKAHPQLSGGHRVEGESQDWAGNHGAEGRGV